MSLIVLNSTKDHQALILYAVHHAPSLIIDCANCANPHTLFRKAPQEALLAVYVIEVDLLYLFRDVLQKASDIAEKKKVHTVVITPWDGLFHYNNNQENNIILQQCWELMNTLAKSIDVAIAQPSKNHYGTHRTKPTPSLRSFDERA